MANNNPDFESISGRMETAEPAPRGHGQGGAPSGQKRTASQQRQASAQSQSTSATAPTLRKQRSSNLVPSASPLAGTSPQTSRNTSPIRKDNRPQPLTTPISTQPSAAAIQRALSAASVPQLQSSGPVSDAVSKLPRASRASGEGGSGSTTPQWPTSPRLKSPPPSATSARRGSAPPGQQKKAEVGQTPSISVQSPAVPAVSSPLTKASTEEPRKAEQQLHAPSKTASRGPSGKSMLETVQENSADSVPEPAAAVQAAADLRPLSKITEDDKPSGKREDGEKHTQHGESGSESAGSKMDQTQTRRQSIGAQQKNTTPRPSNSSKGSFAPLQSAKSRQAEGKQNMTVETETVQSIPQSALNAGDRSGSSRTEAGGSVRLKLSNETIRPKKERKKPSQKARSINQGTGMSSPVSRSRLLVNRASFEDTGDDTLVASSWSSSTEDAREYQQPKRTLSYAQRLRSAVSLSQPNSYVRTLSDKYLRKASSKADIFEARVASAVEQQQENTSDSDETFVYESNPPEQRRPRHHSRTPSVTSAHSMADQQRGVRNFGDLLDDQRRVAGKRSMKFSSNPHNDFESPDSKNGTVRSHHARHFGKFGRNSQASATYDPDSPFTQASKLRTNQLSTRQSRPNSPRSPQSVQQHRPSALLSGRKAEQIFDFDGEGADDERTPLVGTVRTPRNNRHRRNMSDSVRSIDEYYGVRRRSRCGRVGGFLLGICVLAAVVLSAVAFLFLSNRPMYDVRIRKIQNVLASEQEIMLDLLVGAVNPNALSITVTEMNLDVFAKSKHVGNGVPDPGHNHSALTTGESVARRRRKRKIDGTQAPAKTANPSPWQDLSGHWHAPTGGVDHGTDPDPPDDDDDDDDDAEKDATTMLLGRIFHFDQALSFEGSPIKRHQHYSLGELRLMRPGNKTETGGSERWESVLQYPFELILRGVLKYQLPVSMREQGVSVGGSVVVHPEDGVDRAGRMRVEPINHKEHWQWVDLGDESDLPPLGDRMVQVQEQEEAG